MLDPVRAVFDVLEAVPFPQRSIQLAELADQKLFPSILRERVQSTLSAVWTLRVPILQPYGRPADIAAALIDRAIAKLESANQLDAGQGKDASVVVTAQGPQSPITVVDFGSGAGGPIPCIERIINNHNNHNSNEHSDDHYQHTRSDTDSNGDGQHKHLLGAVPFVLTDLRPHLDEWMTWAARSTALTFFPQSVDAADPPPTLVAGHGNGSARSTCPSTPSSSSATTSASSLSSTFAAVAKRATRGSWTNHSSGTTSEHAEHARTKIERIVLRTFHSSFEHLSDAHALRVLSSILHGSIPTSKLANGEAVPLAVDGHALPHEQSSKGGFLIITLNTRTLPTLLLSPVAAFFLSWIYTAVRFSDDPVHLLLTYPVPVIPALVAFDVFSSALRCKTADDIVRMAEVILDSGAKTIEVNERHDDEDDGTWKRVDGEEGRAGNDAGDGNRGEGVSNDRTRSVRAIRSVTDLRRAVQRRKVVQIGERWTLETGRVLYLWPVASLEYVIGYYDESGSMSARSTSTAATDAADNVASL